MDQRVISGTALLNENGLSTKKLSGQTPARKLPFQDATNKSKKDNVINSALKRTSGKKQVHASNFDETFIDSFQFPPDKACFCCGDDRKNAAEAFFDKFINLDMQNLLQTTLNYESAFNIEEEIEPTAESKYLPEKIEIEVNLPPLEVSFTDYEKLHIDLDSISMPSDDVLDESLVEIPEFEWNPSQSEEDLFIGDW